MKPLFLLNTCIPHPAQHHAVEWHSHAVQLAPGSLWSELWNQDTFLVLALLIGALDYKQSPTEALFSNNTIILPITLMPKQTQTILLGELNLLICSYLLSLAVHSLLPSILFLSLTLSFHRHHCNANDDTLNEESQTFKTASFLRKPSPVVTLTSFHLSE